jgi:toxin ParE1/3/4
MSRYTFSPLAEADLSNIYGYIANENLTAAKRLLGLLKKRFQFLAANPDFGEYRGDLADLIPNVRSTTVRGYVIYFRPTPKGPEISRILHGARDPRTAMGG